MRGVNAPELRAQIDILLFEAFPREPYIYHIFLVHHLTSVERLSSCPFITVSSLSGSRVNGADHVQGNRFSRCRGRQTVLLHRHLRASGGRKGEDKRYDRVHHFAVPEAPDSAFWQINSEAAFFVGPNADRVGRRLKNAYICATYRETIPHSRFVAPCSPKHNCRNVGLGRTFQYPWLDLQHYI